MYRSRSVWSRATHPLFARRNGGGGPQQQQDGGATGGAGGFKAGRRFRPNIPLNGHPAGYVLVAILAAAAGIAIAGEDKRTQHRRDHKDSQSTRTANARTAEGAAQASSSSASTTVSPPSPTAVAPFVPPTTSMQPFQWPADALDAASPTVNILTTLSPSEVAAHPLMSRIGRFGLPQLPLSPAVGSGVAPFHLSPPLLLKRAFLSAYNTKTRTADWCLERVTRGDAGDDHASRDHCTFHADSLVAAAFQSHAADYRATGYDRGHLVPAADVPRTCTADQKAVCETFALSNIAPQSPKLNRGYWLQIENHVRALAQTYGEVFAVTGPLWIPQVTTNTNAFSSDSADGASSPLQLHTAVLGSANSFVHVPTHFFKVVLVNPDHRSSSSASSSSPLLAAFIVPNSSVPLSTPLSDFHVPLEQVELLSGWQLFSRLQRTNGADKKKARLSSARTNDVAADLCAAGACDMRIKEFKFAQRQK